MFLQIKAWLEKKNFSSKSVASAWLFLTGAYATVPGFKVLVDTAYSHVPAGAHLVVAGVLPVIVLYWKTDKKST